MTKPKQHQILFFARKGIEINEFIHQAKGHNFKVIVTTSLANFSKNLTSPNTLIVIIEDDQVEKVNVDSTYFYTTASISKIPIKLIIGQKSKFSVLESITFKYDEILSKKSTTHQKQNILDKYYKTARFISNSEEQQERKINDLENPLEVELQKKDRLISALYLQMIMYKNLLRKNYTDWKSLELSLNNKKIRDFHKNLKSNLTLTDTDWEQFYSYFIQVHPHFFKRLKTHSKELTDENLKMCAYIKMGFNNHDIAIHMRVLESSVKRAQTRIKKKMGLTSETTLRKFIQHQTGI